MKQHKVKRSCIVKLLVYPIIVLFGICFILPVLFLLSGSITDNIEWQGRMNALLMETESYIQWRWVPDYPTGEHFKRLLFYTPSFMKLFWNSIKIVGLILFGQLLIGVPSAWGFAVFRFRGRQVIFTLYIILMLLPFQVTMLSKYLVLKEFSLINTHAAVILPAVFSTFPIFLMYRSFTAIPKELLDAARIDGAGEIKTFLLVGLPLSQGGIMAAMVVSFLEAWNMIEEPLAFLQDKALWPLSLYLPEIDLSQAGFSCAASLITLIVSLFVFAIFRDSLEQGILTSALKG